MPRAVHILLDTETRGRGGVLRHEPVATSGKTDAKSAGSGEFVGKTKLFSISKRVRNGEEYYDFVELNPPEGRAALAYIYGVKSGNLTYGSADLWARQSLWSDSWIFCKDDERRKAKPNNIQGALDKATDHLTQRLRRAR